MGKSTKKAIKATLFYILLTAITIVFITPFIFVVYTSLRDTNDIILEGFVAPISKFYPQNYFVAWVQADLMQSSIYSLSITAPALLLTLALSAGAGYAISRLRFKGQSAVFLFILIAMYIPVAVKLIPIYHLYSAIGWTNSLSGIIILQAAMSLPFCVFVLRNFFLTVPKELQEAAIIDGCSYAGIFVRIYLPLSKPSLAVLIILQFTTIWNSFLWELLLMTSKTPVMVEVLSLQSEYGIEWSIQCAGAIIASIPTLLIFLLFQKYFISGLTAGAVKG